MLNLSYFKIMSYINQKKTVDWIDLSKAFNLSKNDAVQILSTLKENDYISFVGDINYVSTYKGKTFIKSFISTWLLDNILSIIAIIISIIALFK